MLPRVETLWNTEMGMCFATDITGAYMRDGLLNQQLHWMPIEESRTFESPEYKVKTSSNMNLAWDVKRKSSTYILTVLIDPSGKVHRQFQPSFDDMTLSVQELRLWLGSRMS